MITIELSKTRIEELELMFQKEISDYQNKIICREKFIYLIKKCNILEFCYLYQKYIGNIELVRRLPEINFSDNDYIETVNEYNSRIKEKNYPKTYQKKNTKKIIRIENMAQKSKKTKKRKK